MKSAVETLNPTRVKLTVEVPFDELKPSMDAAYKNIASQVTVPGFRKGKVPPRIIDQKFGRGMVIQEAVNEALPGFYTQAVTETEIRPLGQPEVDVTAVPDPATGGDLAFTAEVDVRPEFELPELEVRLEALLARSAGRTRNRVLEVADLRLDLGSLEASRGGKVLHPAEDSSFGRFAVLEDPWGAAFSVMEETGD